MMLLKLGGNMVKDKISTQTFVKLNRELHAISLKYYDAIPLDAIFKLFEDQGITPIQEDLTPWSGMLIGSNSRATIELMYEGAKLKRRALTLSWYLMPSGKYEIVAYC
jgi:hypothetical protein